MSRRRARDRKHAIRLLGSYASRKHKPKRRPGRPRKLTSEDIFLIKEIWEISEYPCGKRLKVVLEEWLPFWIKERGSLPEEQLQRVLSTEAATALPQKKMHQKGGKASSSSLPGHWAPGKEMAATLIEEL